MGMHSYVPPQRVAAAVRRFLPARDARILDIGCGVGQTGRALKTLGYSHIDGCDSTDHFLEVAATSGVYASLFLADIAAAPIEVDSDRYDVVVCAGVYSRTLAAGSAIAEIVRLARPGGLIVIALPDDAHEAVAKQLNDEAAAHHVERLTADGGDESAMGGAEGRVLVGRKCAGVA